jgi:hypothetical protein
MSRTWTTGSVTLKGDYGIDGSNRMSTVTNWDPFTSRELVVTLHCTADESKAAFREVLGNPED